MHTILTAALWDVPRRGGGLHVYYSASAASLTSYGASMQLPRHSLFWLVARGMLDAAGALFAVYLIVAVVLLVVGWIMRYRSAVKSRRVDPAGVRCA